MNDGVNWIGPRQCESSGCGQVAVTAAGHILIRSSKRQHMLAMLDRDEWEQFIRAVVAGDFNEVGWPQ